VNRGDDAAKGGFRDPADNPFGTTDPEQAKKYGQPPKPKKGEKAAPDATDIFVGAAQ
jgi:hypothetical protein